MWKACQNPLYPFPITVFMKQFCRTKLWYVNSHTGIVQKNKNPDKESPWCYQSKSHPCSLPQNSSLSLKPLLLDLRYLFVFSWLRVSWGWKVLQPCPGAQPPWQPDSACCSHTEQTAARWQSRQGQQENKIQHNTGCHFSHSFLSLP